jgi:CTP synthase (UTP-ammonia lyase)
MQVSQTILGGTMRLGRRRTVFVKKDCLAGASSLMLSPRLSSVSSGGLLTGPAKLYGNAEYVDERHRHRFEVSSLTGGLWLFGVLSSCVLPLPDARR